MEIVIICHSLNEERNIASFCEGYDFADKIILADGGSHDQTVAIAGQYPNVEIIDTSHLQIHLPDDPYHAFSTPQSHQANLAMKRANELGADWIIRDDIDSWPNSHLRRVARKILAETDQNAVFVYHLYIYGTDQYFPKMNKPGPGLWAWKPAELNIYADETVAFATGLRNVPKEGFKAPLPLALLHYFAPDEETILRKGARKQAQGRKWVHPLKDMYAPPEPLPKRFL